MTVSEPMQAVLQWSVSDEGLLFWADSGVDPDAWAGQRLHTISKAIAHVGPLLRLLDDGVSTWDGFRLRVPYAAIASMSAHYLTGLGLPPVSPYTLMVESGQFSVTESEFKFETVFKDSNRRQVELSSRMGCVAMFGARQVILPEPQFSVLQAVETFNQAAVTGAESSNATQLNIRLQQIARLHALLGIGADQIGQGESLVQSDEYLRDFRVVVPTQFTLGLTRTSDGIAIDPELLVAQSSGVPGALSNDLAVPTARQREFASRFRQINAVRGTYALGSGWFVALPQSVQTALRVVKDVQRSDAGTRASFAAQPRQFLKARLEGQLADEELEAIFFDGDYGDRVTGVGLWQPKVLPWLKRRTESWLPIEECGITVGDAQIPLPPGEIQTVRETIERAIAAGQANVVVAGHPVPATTQTLEALGTLSEAVAVAPTPDPPADVLPVAEPRQQVVLLIKDNLDGTSYTARHTARAGIKDVPKTLVSNLLPHQLQALHWLQDHWVRGTSGALLADDMGLGKTFETLAFICWLREQIANGAWARSPVLIVAPTGLLENWRAEMAKHIAAHALGNVVLCWGPKLASLRRSPGRDTRDGIPVLDTQELSAADVVLTTYETLRDHQQSFGLVNWSLAIFDEAQKIKNPQTLSTNAAKAVANKATLAVALTGTPVENRLSDLWCIADTVQPMRLGLLKQFVEVYEGDGESVVSARKRLRTDLTTDTTDGPALMLRRLKKDHLPGLPKVSVHRFEELMPSVQASAYAAAVERARGPGGNATMLKALHEMRTVSLHPDITAATSADEVIQHSARVARMIEILDAVHEKGEKALIFVEFQSVQGVLIEVLQQRYAMSAAPFVINGDVPGDRRRRRVEEFQDRSGFDVMLLSPRAGGVGLTLTAANHVIHLARWWNPAVEDQCTDRVNRIGQTREVHVYLPLARHPVFGEQSFDLLLDALLERKRAQSEDALTPPDVSSEDVSALFAGATAGASAG